MGGPSGQSAASLAGASRAGELASHSIGSNADVDAARGAIMTDAYGCFHRRMCDGS